MREWVRGQWEQVRGNAKWQVIMLIGCYVLGSISLLSAQKWMFQRATVLDTVLITAVPFLITAIILVVRSKRAPNMKIQVGNTSGPSTSIFLTITNLGVSTTFSAFCDIIGHPDGVNDFRRGEFRCGWDDGKSDRCLIRKDETESVVVASFSDVVPYKVSEMILWEVIAGDAIPRQSARWSQNPDENLPTFRLRMRIVAENTKSPKFLAFTVRPARFTGPLEVVNMRSLP